MASARPTPLPFFGVSALLYVASATLTIFWSASMSRMGDMPMPGGWAMSMSWMRMPGQTWAVSAASFLGMWAVMMVAMMLPSLTPMLWRYRQVVRGAGKIRLEWLTLYAAAGYFVVWTVIGMAAFPLGVALATVEMQQPEVARAVPIAAGVGIVMAGVIQFTAWKLRHLACCREASPSAADVAATTRAAWSCGVRLGVHCVSCCGNLMVVLLVVGMMDLRVMAAVTAAITAERLAPSGERVASAIGVVLVGTGVVLLAS